MKTRLFLDNGRMYEIESDVQSLLNNHLTDENGELHNAFVQLEDFYINPQHIAALEEIDEKKHSSIGF
ncbi:hypothetical protein GCM10011391_18650 [Pullulanibacillus camelliae]|uniref:Uncharacterized protein n=1 Tax=Pullulanibacillus camelliae TaxID=1707096 RepID=A0A8J2YDJ0_9BACL|nr:hypothetical protein [Pullulanibacillus camelliae]GGE40136.1 hypothetical protein GCM10011391_18650 [Pullulanibacillus camelliae]